MEQAKQDTLMIKNATFITSAGRVDQFLKTQKPTVAICGKSNVGKSSFINMMANRKQLAKTSRDPGRTRLVNYFDFGEFVLADLPGYGYAKVSKAEKEKWGALLETFLQSQKIRLLISLVDIRHDPTNDDKMMINYLYHYQIPFVLVATKADKLSKSKIKPQLMEIAKHLRVGISDLTATSAQTSLGKDALLALIEKAILVGEN